MASERRGFIKELFARRVPQIMGIYIGACWMTVEMGDWVTERLGLAPDLIAYLFVLMIALLPSVAVLAWNHGAPGRDRSPRFEKFFVPANLTAALVAVFAFFGYAPPGTPGSSIGAVESAVIERTVIDEAGEAQTFMVARAGFHRSVFVSFWQLEAGPAADVRDWRQYAISWLLDVGLNRDPLISVVTPFSGDVLSDYAEAGYPDGIGEPSALAMRQAQRAGARYLVRGTIQHGADGLTLTARVIETASGAVIGDIEARGRTVIEASAELIDGLAPLLTPDVPASDQRYTRIPLAEAATPAIDALEAMTAGLTALFIERDFEAADRELERALELDPAFALAAVWLNQLHRATGDFNRAVEAANRALVHEYKLDTQTRFAMKANRHALAGDYATAMRVLGMWTEVHPESFTAWQTLAQNQIVLGEVEGAAVSLQRARELDPDNASVLRQMATVDQLAGEYDAAAERLRSYIEQAPEDVQARIELGQVLTRAGQPDAALEVFETAELLGDDPLTPRLNTATVLLRQARFEQAEALLDGLLATTAEPARRADVLRLRFDLLAATGRFDRLIEELDRNETTLQQVAAPIQFWTTWSDLVRAARVAQGDFDAAAEALSRAEAALGEPLNRFVALDRIQLGALSGAPHEELEAQLERLRFFETQFSFGGALSVVRWGEALVLADAGDTAAAVDRMREARDTFNASGLSLNLVSAERFDVELARMLMLDGQFDEAAGILDGLLARHPAHVDARWTRIELAMQQDDADRARDDLDRFLAQWAEADPALPRLREARRLRESL